MHSWADLDENDESEGDNNSDDSGQDSNDDSAVGGGEEVERRHLTRAKLLDSLLVKLSSCDILNLKPYRHFGRLLEKVLVPLPDSSEAEEAGTYVQVYFDCSGAAYVKTYTVPYDGTAAILYREGSPELAARGKSLLDLPSHVLRRVYEYATASPCGIIFDLDSRSVTGIDLRPLQVNRTLRLHSSLFLVMAQTSTITLRSTTTEIATSSADFAALQELFQLVRGPYGTYDALA